MVGCLQIKGTTRLMGIIGDPIAQAKTPATINALFSSRGADIACVPLHVPVQELGAIWAGLKGMPNVVGFRITLPHKQSALQLCDSIDPLVKRVGIVNVVRRERNGDFRGYQFDGKGFVRGLQARRIAIENRDVLILGAGGAAVAIAFAPVEVGANSVTITNRTLAKAEGLAGRPLTAEPSLLATRHDDGRGHCATRNNSAVGGSRRTGCRDPFWYTHNQGTNRDDCRTHL